MTHFKQKEDEEFVIFEVPGEELEGVLKVARGEEHLRLGDQSLWIVAVLQILSCHNLFSGEVLSKSFITRNVDFRYFSI